MKDRGQWSSSFVFILAASGSAIGLGNLWKFPYITGVYGGGAFVLVYLACIALVGIPIFMAELYIGQQTQMSPIAAFEKLDGKKTKWSFIGWMGFVSSFLILSFYSVVGGWVLDFVYLSVTHQFSGKTDAAIGGMFGALVSNPQRVVFWHAVFMALTVGIVTGGLSKGIERWTKLLMPALFGILIVLFFWCFTLDGFGEAIAFLFAADFSKLSSEAVLVAVGHSFFTLSLGMGTMITYGSYLKKSENLLKISLAVSFMDTLIALVAGVVIFSVVFTFGQEPGSGPGLMFSTLPTLFSKMPTGNLVSIAFFVLVAFAALSSAISLIEVVVAYLVDSAGYPRKKASFIIGIVVFMFGLLSAFSFNIMSDVKIGKFTFFDLFDGLTTNLFLPLGGLLISVYVAWKLGRPAVDKIVGKGVSPIVKDSIYWTLAVIAPASVAWVLYNGFGKWLYG